MEPREVWRDEERFPRPDHPGPEFHPPAPEAFEDGAFEDEPLTFAAMRRIEYTARLHHMALRAVLQGDFLPPAQLSALKVIIRSPGMSQRELADALHIQRATATVMLQKMEKAGFIDRRPDREDQRVSRIYPTEMAIAQENEKRLAVNDYFQHCFTGLEPEEFRQLEQILSKLGNNIRDVLSAAPLDKE